MEFYMIKTIDFENKKIEYDLQYKKVKNINLRIKHDGKIFVSANKSVPGEYIEEFLLRKKEFILNVLDKYENMIKLPKIQYFDERELISYITEFSKEIYPYYKEKGIEYPKIKFRKMVSCWGICRSLKGELTFNKNLKYAPKECVRYVVWHEFTHFLIPNHSDKFYSELSKVCPEWKKLKNTLKDISIR